MQFSVLTFNSFCILVDKFSSKDVDTETSLKAVNNQLRKVDTEVKVALFDFAPLAIRCSLKDLVPYDVVRPLDG